MSRPVLTGGIVPERTELRRLEAARGAARRVYERFQDHDSEIALARAEQALAEFLAAHPEIAV